MVHSRINIYSCLKSTGLGVTEFMLRLMAWLCVRDDTYREAQMVIITGPNLSLAVKLISRLKAIFEPKLNIAFQDKETVVRSEWLQRLKPSHQII